jgi:creatinine amidohydrolase
MKKHAIKHMTFVEFRERIVDEPVVIIPLGSQEEQGPHAPMGDFMLSEKLAQIAAEHGDAIVAPTIPFGYADVFRCVPGGIQLRAETFCALLEDTITAFLDHGLERIVLFNGHTGNTSLIDQTVRGFKASHGIIIPSINIWKAIPRKLWHDLHENLGEKAGGHGADPITSVYYHLFPELMRPDLIEASSPKKAFELETIGLSAVSFENSEVLVPLDVFDVNDHGLIGGDASLSNAEIGKAFADHITGFAANFVRYFRQCNPRSFEERLPS